MTASEGGSPWIDTFNAREWVQDGSLVAIGGVGTSRKPMSLIRALAGSGVRDLRLVSVLGSVDVDFLIASGVVAEVHTAGVAIDGVGMAPQYRQARQNGEVTVVEWSEGSLHAALEAGSRGLPSLACGTSARSDVVAGNDWLTVAADPFTGEPVVHARAITPDLALLHACEVSADGDVFIDGDAGFDVVTACASHSVVVSAERATRRPGRDASLSRVWIDAVVRSPGGAWPTACYPAAAADPDALQAWVRSKGDRSVLTGAIQ